jgi:drug/metabolite transporter (DMT)-like permease
LGWAFLGETITPLFLAGGALIVAGLLILRPSVASPDSGNRQRLN